MGVVQGVVVCGSWLMDGGDSWCKVGVVVINKHLGIYDLYWEPPTAFHTLASSLYLYLLLDNFSHLQSSLSPNVVVSLTIKYCC